jgi:hypothetical protein
MNLLNSILGMRVAVEAISFVGKQIGIAPIMNRKFMSISIIPRIKSKRNKAIIMDSENNSIMRKLNFTKNF